jgi:hypothetical protein
VLWRIFGPKWEELTGGWRRLHNKELHNLYGSPNIIRMIKIKEYEMGRTCNTNGRDEKFIQYFGWKI